MRLLVISIVLAASLGNSQGQTTLCWNEPDGTFLPDPSSRGRFIWCSNGNDIIGYCPDGQEFNPFDRICDDAHDANIPVHPPMPTRPPVAPPVVPPAATTQAPRNPCFSLPDGTFLPDPSSRERFFFCSSGESIVGYCPSGTLFDERELFCDEVGIQTTARPGPTRPPVATTQAPRNPCFSLPDGTFLPDPSSRERFFFCSSGENIVGYCPSGTLFDEQQLICDEVGIQTTARPGPTRPPVATTQAPRNPCFSLPDGTFLPDPSSRERFFFCSSGESIVGYCPSGTLFDEQELFCDEGGNQPTARPDPTRPPVVPTTTRAAPTNPTRAPPANPTRAPPANPTRAPPANPTRAPPANPTRAPPANPTRAPPANPTRAPPANPTRAPVTRAPATRAPATRAPVRASATKAPVTRAPAATRKPL